MDAAAQRWISETDARANSDRAAVDAEAARARAAVDRDAVRASAVALGDWHTRRGEPQAALRCFLRARDYCSTPRDVSLVCLRAADAAAAAGSWAHVSSYASKAASASSSSSSSATVGNGRPSSAAAAAPAPFLSSAAVATALAGCAAAAFDAGRWREAALGFVRAAAAADVDGGGVAGIGGGFSFDAATKAPTYPLDADASLAPSLASPLDVALCGGLACLAALDRGELASVALAAAGFRDALALVPPLLSAVEAAAAARFGDALTQLREGVLPRARLDARASRAAPQLAAAAARRCLVQYAAPFSRLSLDAAKEKLGFGSRGELDEELAALVRKGAVRGKLDVPGGLLTREAGGEAVAGAAAAAAAAALSRPGDGGGGALRPPLSAVDTALEAGLAYVADSRALLLRAAMLSKGMVQQAPAAPATPAPAAATTTTTTTPGAEGGDGGGAAAPGDGGRTRRGGSGQQQQQQLQRSSGSERLQAIEPPGMSSGGEEGGMGGPWSGRG